jgi:hypothetical protein
MQTIARSSFTTVKTEGGLLPADLLQRIADGRAVEGLRPEDYHLLPGERLNEAINRAWNRCLGAWLSFDDQRRKLPETDTGTTLTRERWLLVLFQELGYGRLQLQRGGLASDDGATYPISHVWEQTPIHLVTFRQGLDRRSDVATQVKRSPHSLMQELLNRSRTYTWGFISNGLQLRILRDNASLRRAAYVEFDLESMMAGELYAEFALLWLVCHQSRVESTVTSHESPVMHDESPETDEESPATNDASLVTRDASWLERWSKLAAEQGTRAMDALRDGVAEAIAALGSGFVAHPANQTLRAHLRDGDLSTQAYYQQLRRLVYRMIFLFVAEDRDLLLLPDTPPAVRQRYDAYYSLRRLRDLAGAVRGGPHADLYRRARLLFAQLRTGYPALGLPGLGSALFSARATPDLDGAELANQPLLAAIRALTLTVEASVRRPVDYRNLDSEELGSIYESLLELHPAVNLAAATFELSTGAGSERKTTGSHYTPTPLVESLLDTALEPVVADRLAKAEELWRNGSDRSQDARRALQEAAILSIKVCDGAMGSGHMLIGAGRRLARHLARIRTGDAEPAPVDLRAALRDVVRHCLYGVDVNDMAVELCKVALWMETMEPGKPLSFLDAHIQCGNSLIGVTPGLDISEIPDDAFQPVTGDDRTTATGLRKRNKKEREGQLALAFGAGEAAGATERHAGKRAAMVAAIEELAEDGVAQVAAKAQSYADYLQSTEYKWARWEADAWTAAFFWPMPAGDPWTMAAPTQEVLNVVRSGKLKRHEDLLKEVRRIAKRHQFFHWALQFPDVFQGENGGFDVILMNPPWERIKLQEKEWFAARSPAIAGAPNAAARKRMIAALEQDDPALWRAFQDDVRAAESESHFIRNSGKYPLCGRGDVNTYAVFAELVRQVLSPAGRVGIIVPSGIATDDTTKFYFQDVMETGALASLYDFENRHKLFPAVDSRMKFCLLTLRGEAEGAGKAAEFVFFALDVDDLREEERRFSLTAAEIALLNPNTRTCPIFRSKRDAELTKAIYRRVPVLIKEGPPEENPWGVSFLRMLDMSNDSHLFHTREQLEQAGWRLEGNRFVRGAEVMLPLYEAKMLHQFDHRWATYDGLETRDLTSGEKDDPNRRALSRYWVQEWSVVERIAQMPKELLAACKEGNAAAVDAVLTFWLASYCENHGQHALTDSLYTHYVKKQGLGMTTTNAMLLALGKEKIGAFERQYPLSPREIALIAAAAEQGSLAIAQALIEAKTPTYLIGFRDITNATNERTAIFSMLPQVGVGNNAPIILHDKNAAEIVLFIASVSCLAFDSIARVNVGGTHMNFFVVKQLAVLPPEIYAALCPWTQPLAPDVSLVTHHASRVTLAAWLLPRVLELTYTAWDLQPFARDCGYDGPPFRWDEDRRFLLRCELDAAYFHLYGIARDDVDYILETFPIVKRKEIARHGEYRTKRVILEMYDAMAAAMQGGAPYVTRLEPPPADARVAHGG